MNSLIVSCLRRIVHRTSSRGVVAEEMAENAGAIILRREPHVARNSIEVTGLLLNHSAGLVTAIHAGHRLATVFPDTILDFTQVEQYSQTEDHDDSEHHGIFDCRGPILTFNKTPDRLKGSGIH